MPYPFFLLIVYGRCRFVRVFAITVLLLEA